VFAPDSFARTAARVKRLFRKKALFVLL